MLEGAHLEILLRQDVWAAGDGLPDLHKRGPQPDQGLPEQWRGRLPQPCLDDAPGYLHACMRMQS